MSVPTTTKAADGVAPTGDALNEQKFAEHHVCERCCAGPVAAKGRVLNLAVTGLEPDAHAARDLAPIFNEGVTVPRWQHLRAQQMRLNQFSQFHTQTITRTMHDPNLFVQASAQLSLRASGLSTGGLLGVFAAEDVPLSFRCPYPGVLMSSALHNDLHARYQIPTAVEMGPHQVLVGDPCAFACIVNGIRDADKPSFRSNVEFAWDEIDIAGRSLCVRPIRPLVAGEELFLDYGTSFWTRSNRRTAHYCQVCFGRDCSALNKMFLCDGRQSGGGQHCAVGQHELCFENALALPSPSSKRNWYCRQHKGL